MTDKQLQKILDKSFTISVEIKTNTFQKNQPYTQISGLLNSGFSFTLRELLHAIGSKTASLPSNKKDECINSAYLYAHILDPKGQHLGYKPGLPMDSDLKTNRSNEIGIGIGCLLAEKQFNVGWDSLESIRGIGKRFDYRATRGKKKHAYEFKGTSHISKQTDQVKNGIEKKADMHKKKQRYDVELIVSTYMGFSNEKPRIILADPPFDGFEDEFSELANEIYRLRYLSRLSQFLGDVPLARRLYVQSRLIDIQENENARTAIVALETLIQTRELSRYEQRLIPLTVNNHRFIGRWINYWRPANKSLDLNEFQIPNFSENQKLEIFQGLRSEYYEFIKNNQDTIEEPDIRSDFETFSNEVYSGFSDGTIMGYRLAPA